MTSADKKADNICKGKPSPLCIAHNKRAKHTLILLHPLCIISTKSFYTTHQALGSDWTSLPSDNRSVTETCGNKKGRDTTAWSYVRALEAELNLGTRKITHYRASAQNLIHKRQLSYSIFVSTRIQLLHCCLKKGITTYCHLC